MTISTVPTETLKDFIKGQGYGVAPSAVVAICEQLLAVREAQPVAWQAESKVRCNRMTTLNKEVAADWEFKGFTVTPLYTAPPAVPNAMNIATARDRVIDQNNAAGYVHGYNACRAAMRQSCDAVRDLSTPVDPQIAEYEQALDMVGMSVSVDVSTSDDNAGYRYFGRVTEVQQSANPKDKGGVVLLVQDDVESNFDDGIAPAGFKLVPVELTAENGAKASLIGEFTEVKFINCPECFGDAECESCDGSGRIRVEAPVSWTTIKAIWKKGIEHFDSLAAAPTPTKLKVKDA